MSIDDDLLRQSFENLKKVASTEHDLWLQAEARAELLEKQYDELKRCSYHKNTVGRRNLELRHQAEREALDSSKDHW